MLIAVAAYAYEWVLTAAMSLAPQAQLDLSVEHSNIQRFRTNFSSDSTVVFPTVFKGLCTKSCLVQTWEEGEGLRDFFLRIDRAALTQLNPAPEMHAQRAAAASPHLTHQQPSTSDILNCMSSEEILQLSRELGIVGAQAFLKMLIRDNFVHVSRHVTIIHHSLVLDDTHIKG